MTMTMTKKQARALGVIAGLTGQPRVWRHQAATDAALLGVWRAGYGEGAEARAHEERARAKTQQRIIAVSSADLFPGVPERVWARARIVPLPAAEETVQQAPLRVHALPTGDPLRRAVPGLRVVPLEG